ncbi:MAG: hypothetical protein ACI4UN_01720 [Muribaculaceae bacterium]
MRRFFCAIMLLQGVAAIAGDGFDYPYMAFQGIDGTKQTVAVESLEITFANGKLMAHSAADEVSLELSQLDKMYFTTEQAGVAGTFAPVSGTTTVYSMQGVNLGTFASLSDAVNSLQRGLYVVKTDGRTQKMAVK